jgi:hypothetical protein
MADPNVARWNSAWGIVGLGSFPTTPKPLTTTDATITNAVTFTAITGRRYRVSVFIRAGDALSPGGFIAIKLNRTGLPSTGDTLNYAAPNPGTSYAIASASWVFAGDGFTRNYSISARSAVTGLNLYLEAEMSSWYIEDVGPVSQASDPPAAPASVWSEPTLLNGWSNLGGGWAPAALRLVGDMVQVRGVIVHGGAIAPGTLVQIFTLPPGYRPPIGLILSANCAGANYGDTQCRIDVGSDGQFSIWSGAAGQNIHVYTSINLAFSVTA